jgi:hypothetical protein
VIQNRLWRREREEAIQKFIGDLRSNAGVQENAALLSRVRVESGSKPASKQQ